jgi:hypothetical protein
MRIVSGHLLSWSPAGPFAQQRGQLGDVRFFDPAPAVGAVRVGAGMASDLDSGPGPAATSQGAVDRVVERRATKFQCTVLQGRFAVLSVQVMV